MEIGITFSCVRGQWIRLVEGYRSAGENLDISKKKCFFYNIKVDYPLIHPSIFIYI